jgi:uncharacterized protein YaiI (UPF0178 family)
LSKSSVRIFVDADACPGVVKDIIMRAATSRKVQAIFVANKVLPLPASEFLKQETVAAGLDKADQFIAEDADVRDLVVTADVPLAHILVKKGIVAINPRGLIYTEDNIGDRISVRDLLSDLRDAGEMTSGPKPFGDKEKRAFAASFDRVLTQLQRRFPTREA